MQTTAKAVSVAPIATHIAIVDGILTTTTHDIAEVYEKNHRDVLRIVNQRMEEAGEWGMRNFTHTPYTNPQNGQTYPVIRMTKKGFHFVVGKFTGAKAVAHQIAFADEFERMEAELQQPAQPALPEFITAAQAGEIATRIGERFPDGRDRPYAWSRFNAHFRLASYKHLPATRFDEACAYLETMPMKNEVKTLPASPNAELEQHLTHMLQRGRHLLTVSDDGTLHLIPVPHDAYILTDEDIVRMIAEPGVFSRSLLPRVIEAAAKRLQ